uniref:Uncharacterized protein n=1 Tax=Anguilla anguilla TaxID=7936 RepID=A0A0E9QM37_ANGAN
MSNQCRIIDQSELKTTLLIEFPKWQQSKMAMTHEVQIYVPDEENLSLQVKNI